MGPEDVVLGVLPMFHAFGLNAVLGWAVATGAALIVEQRFDPEQTLGLIGRYGVTRLPLAPPALHALLTRPDLRAALKTVKVVLTGASTLDRGLADRFEQATGLHVHQGYGLTEASPVVTSTLCSETFQPGSVGAALPGIDIRLLDELGQVPEGDDPGEIWIRGANMFSGYWPDGDGGPDEDGWWATGDVGFLDATGDLFLVDRLKELVIVSGFNVYPIEVEDVIREVPSVVDAAVIGVEDPATGEAVVAYVMPSDGAAAAEVEAAVRRHCSVRLARFKQPSRVEVVADLPLTVTGKVQKGRLRGMERRRSLGLLE
jgi:long-chain acyl-CoA synthetase